MYSTTLNPCRIYVTCPYYTATFMIPFLHVYRDNSHFYKMQWQKKIYCGVWRADNKIIVVQLCQLAVYTKGGACFSS